MVRAVQEAAVDARRPADARALVQDLAEADASLRPVLERVREQVALLAATLLDHLDYEERERLPALGRLEVHV